MFQHAATRSAIVLPLGCIAFRGFDFGMIGEEDDVVNRRRNITDAPIELLFNKEGIANIITSQLTRVYDLNILKMVAEQLHPGDNFNNIGDGTFEGVTESTIGRCNVTFDVDRRSEAESQVEKRLFHHDFRLKLLYTVEIACDSHRDLRHR